VRGGGCSVESRCRAECWGGNNVVGVVCSLITQVPLNMSDTAKGSDVCGWAGGEEGGRGAWAPDGLGGLFCAGECWGRGQLQEGMQASSQLPTAVFHACCPYICNHACCPYICNGMQASDTPIVVKAFRTHDLAMLKQHILAGVHWPPPATHNPIANILPTQVSTSSLLCVLPMRSGTMAP
jgi:hypothetical protein